LRARPDVSGVSRAGVVPLGGDRERQGFRIPGHASPSGRPIILIDVNPVGRDYFEVAGIRLLKGRGFTAQDGPATRGVVVVNETMASRYWPKGDAVGRTISLAGQASPDLEIVGIAKDIKYYSLDETPRPYVYLSAGQAGGAGGILHVRANGDPRPVIAALKREGAAIDPAVVIDRPMTFEELRQLPLAGRRAMTVMANVFGAIALVLTIVGLYGTMSNTVAQRTREIGVRMAFGADAVRVSRLVVGAGLVPVAAGILFGFVLAGIVGRLVANELFGITPGDPATHAAAAAAVLLASIAALAGPARRATRVDPVAILRE
jgi:putative ABC transport system permease protein